MRERLLRSLSYAGDSKEKEYKYFFSLESGVSNFINKLSRTGDHKNKEYKYSFLLWSGASGGRKSPSASPQINQKNKKASFLFFRFIGASGGSRTLVSSLGRKYNSRYTTLA